MGKGEPVCQLLGRGAWGVAVERHQGRRAARHPCQSSAPCGVVDGRYFDRVLPAVDDFFEAMNDHGEVRMPMS